MPMSKKPKPPAKPKAPGSAKKKTGPTKTAKTKEYEKYLAKIMR